MSPLPSFIFLILFFPFLFVYLILSAISCEYAVVTSIGVDKAKIFRFMFPCRFLDSLIIFFIFIFLFNLSFKLANSCFSRISVAVQQRNQKIKRKTEFGT